MLSQVQPTLKERLLCKIFGHQRSSWKITVEGGYVVAISWYCNRCGYETKIPVDNSDRMDIAVGFAFAGLDKSSRKTFFAKKEMDVTQQ